MFETNQIYPGFIATNICRNALVGQAGEKYSENDSAIANGLPAEEVADRILEAIYFRDAETEVLNTWWMSIQALVCSFSTSLHRYLGFRNYEYQKRMQREIAEKKDAAVAA